MPMGLFDWLRTSKRQDDHSAEWWERLHRVESDMKQLALDWETTYDKIRRALATLSKRQQREADAGEQPEAAAVDAPPVVAVADASDYAKLRSMYPRR